MGLLPSCFSLSVSFFTPFILSSTFKEGISCWNIENDFKVEREEWKRGGGKEGGEKEER